MYLSVGSVRSVHRNGTRGRASPEPHPRASPPPQPHPDPHPTLTSSVVILWLYRPSGLAVYASTLTIRRRWRAGSMRPYQCPQSNGGSSMPTHISTSPSSPRRKTSPHTTLLSRLTLGAALHPQPHPCPWPHPSPTPAPNPTPEPPATHLPLPPSQPYPCS